MKIPIFVSAYKATPYMRYCAQYNSLYSLLRTTQIPMCVFAYNANAHTCNCIHCKSLCALLGTIKSLHALLCIMPVKLCITAYNANPYMRYGLKIPLCITAHNENPYMRTYNENPFMRMPTNPRSLTNTTPRLRFNMVYNARPDPKPPQNRKILRSDPGPRIRHQNLKIPRSDPDPRKPPQKPQTFSIRFFLFGVASDKQHRGPVRGQKFAKQRLG